MKVLSGLERLLLVLGLLLLCVYTAARIYGVVASRVELHRFWETQKAAAVRTSQQGEGTPDFRLWSPQRIAAFKTSLNSPVSAALGVLRIPAINLEVPVLEGTDDLTLNRAVGHISGTSAPGQGGNIGIAGHRDGFFRGLKDVRPGDVIELVARKRSDRYLVDEVLIVSPEDVAVLRPRAVPSLTLVTCYPFYFVGSAPQRYIVHAAIEHPVPPEKVGH